MSKGQRQERRARKRGVVAAAIVVAVMTAAAPAMALLGINVTVPIPAVVGGVPSVTVPLQVSVPGLLGVTNLQGGLTQTQTTLTQLVNGLNKGANVAAPFVQAHATEAAQTAIENLQDRLEATAAAALAVDTTAAQSELMGVTSDLQAQALGEVAGVLPLALTTGLQVVQDVVSPVCSLTAVPTSFVPGVGVDLSRTYKALSPTLQQTDAATDALIQQTYKYVYDNALASVAAIPTAGPIASALLTLLKFNWTTSYTPPGSTTPIVTSTPALIDVPTPLNVDGSTGIDLCATLTFALEGSGTSITGIKFTQTITKMPLAKPTLPVDVMGGLLNVLNLGYDTTESTAPIVYTTSATVDLAGMSVNLDNNYAVHRGSNLTIPPAILGSLHTGGLANMLPIIPPLTTPAPKPIVTQKICIGACSGLALKYRFENVPTSTHVDAPLLPLTGTKVNYVGAQASDSFSYKLAAGTAGFATVVGRDRAVPDNPLDKWAPASSSVPTNVSWCYDFTSNTCSNNQQTGDKSSVGITASGPTFVENFLISGATDPVACSSSTTYDSHINTAGTFSDAHTPGGTAVGSGRIYIDTGNQPASGCIGMIAGAALGSAPPAFTMPAGFQANARNATYHTTNLGSLILGVTPDSKTGTITCPAGTSAVWTSISGSIGVPELAPVICSLPPVNTALPTIGGLSNGHAYVDATLTSTTGTWTPGSPNTPTYTRQWNKCTGAVCTPIPGATGSSYTLNYGSYPAEPTDFGHTFTVTVTATNLDGAVSVTSAATPAAELPPAPTIATAPVLNGNNKIGLPTTTTNGTYNNGATTFTYQWQRCDAAGNTGSCVDIPGATSSSYTPTLADKGLTIRSGVVGTNHGGSAPINYSPTLRIPPDPMNVSAPGIKSGPTNAVGASVATGDNLIATTGLWLDTTQPFTYQWQLCDPSGTPASCQDIAGATGASYQLVHPTDDGNTVRVVVTGHGVNGSTAAASGTTGVILFNDLSAKNVTQIPDGTVNATAAGAGTTTYVGGAFDTVGAPTGGSGLVADSGAGSTVSLASATAGATNGGVMATVPDGAGGYFLGGTFTQVKGVQCPGLAHLFNDGTVDQAYCYSGLTGSVNALTRFSGTAAGTSKVLVVGGSFAYAGHNNLMFIDPAAPASPVFITGGDPNGAVNTVAANLSSTTANNNLVYLGGKFSSVSGTPAALLASGTLTWTGGQLTSVARNNWSAGVCIGTPSGTSTCSDPAASVNTLASLSSGYVAVGGRFNSNYRVTAGSPTNQATRNNALLVGDNGAAPSLLGWNPNIGGGNQTVYAIAVGPTPGGISSIPVYIGGDFTTINGFAAKNLGEFGSTILGTSAGAGGANNAGPMNTWAPNPNGPVYSLAWAGNATVSSLIVGGGFTTINTGTIAAPTTLVRHRLAKINIGSATGTVLPAVDGTWDPNAGRTVRTVSRDATLGNVTVGGDFVVLGGKTRNNVAEFDPNTGVTTWNPGVDGTVNAVAFRGGNVYVGGTFANAGGAARANLAALDSGSNSATSWNPGATGGAVNAIATDAGNVYVGGTFTNVGGQPRDNLAAVSNAGAVTGWNPGTDGAVKALAVSGDDVYVGGTFALVQGVARSNAAAVSASTGLATGFDPNADGAVNAIAVDGAGVYLGGAFTLVGGQDRDHVALVDPTTGAVLAWDAGTDGTVNAVFLVGSQVFVGGDFTVAGGAPRTNLAALTNTDGSALSFKPDPNGSVKALSRTSGGSIAVGGSFTIISGQAAPALGFYGG